MGRRGPGAGGLALGESGKVGSIWAAPQGGQWQQDLQAPAQPQC